MHSAQPFQMHLACAGMKWTQTFSDAPKTAKAAYAHVYMIIGNIMCTWSVRVQVLPLRHEKHCVAATQPHQGKHLHLNQRISHPRSPAGAAALRAYPEASTSNLTNRRSGTVLQG